MTELFIDGVSVVLPKDFSVAVKRENPMFTKNGEYTYDITLPLTNPTNAKLYEHLNRLNSVTEVKTKRTAILRADNRVYCNGTEVITGWTDDTVSIQIASGNSELNYVIGGDLQISFLDMKETTLTEGDYSPNEKTYPETDYNLAPLYSDADGKVLNQWNYYFGTNETPNWIPDGIYIPQPYLCAYIKELLNAIGYTLEVNQLEDTIYKDVYICHAQHTGKWAEMLPGWSVVDFLSEIEKLFNMSLVVNNRDRTARLLFRSTILTGQSSSHVRQVVDEYESEVDEEPDVEDATTCDVNYSLGTGEFWKFACLGEGIRKAAKYGTIPADYEPDKENRLSLWFRQDDIDKSNTIYTDETTGRQFLYLGILPAGNDVWPEYLMVDQFAELSREEPDNEMELNIIPAEMVQCEWHKLQDGTNAQLYRYFMWLPSPDAVTDTEEEEEDLPLADRVRNGVEEENEESSGHATLSLAFYTGDYLINKDGLGNSALNAERIRYPIPYIDEYAIRPCVGAEQIRFYYRTNSVGASLRLAALDNLFYQTQYDIDYNHGIKLSSYDPNVYDPMAVFEIRHKRYVCKEIEYTLDAHGRKGAWTGTFYPIKLSDTEADLRWILADGKWRDGGVWLDNGRWLDS